MHERDALTCCALADTPPYQRMTPPPYVYSPCGNTSVFQRQNMTLPSISYIFRFPESGSQYPNCFRKIWNVSHEPASANRVCLPLPLPVPLLVLHTRAYTHCLGCMFAQGYRVTVRRLELEQCCDYLIIRGGRTGYPEYRYPRETRSNVQPQRSYGYGSYGSYPYRSAYQLVEESYGSNGVGDVVEFPDAFITITVYTDQSVSGDGFELEITPAASTPVERRPSSCACQYSYVHPNFAQDS